MNTEQTSNMFFEAGSHYGYGKARRHPSMKPFIFGSKEGNDIFDIEKIIEQTEKAKNFVREISNQGGTILFVGVKAEAKDVIERTAISLSMPYVTSRWVGGTLTNFFQIKKRIQKLVELREAKDLGTLEKYTKKERVLIDKDIKNLTEDFGGLVSMNRLPQALFVIDARREYIAVTEAKKLGIPVIALCGSDNDTRDIAHVIPANDSSLSSISLFAAQIAEAFKSVK